jgi:hypothetical protein
MEFWPEDAWSVCSRPRGAVYAICILALLGAIAYFHRGSEVAFWVSTLVLALVFAAFLCFAGTSDQTWSDPGNALGILLLALALLLDGFFVAGASTFGPTPVLDVAIGAVRNDRMWIFINGKNILVRLPDGLTDSDLSAISAYDEYYDQRVQYDPLRVQVSLWDNQVHWMLLKNTKPPRTIGKPPHRSIRALAELFAGLACLLGAFAVWDEGRRRGIQWRVYDLFAVLAAKE